MSLDYGKIKEAAQNYGRDMTKFLREIVKYPGESCMRVNSLLLQKTLP